jgi:hypothetical protein
MPYIPDLKDILIFSLISLGTFTYYKVSQLHKCELNIAKIDKNAIQHDLVLQKEITKEFSNANNKINAIEKEYFKKSTSKIKDKKLEELIEIYNNL